MVITWLQVIDFLEISSSKAVVPSELLLDVNFKLKVGVYFHAAPLAFFGYVIWRKLMAWREKM